MSIEQAAAFLIVAEVIIIVVAVVTGVLVGRFIRRGAREMPPVPGESPNRGSLPAAALAPGSDPPEWTGSPPTYGTTDD